MIDSQFKVCLKCGAVCQSIIEQCPALLKSQRKKKSWFRIFRSRNKSTIGMCESRVFRETTIEELGRIRRKEINPYIKKWPEDIWPTIPR